MLRGVINDDLKKAQGKPASNNDEPEESPFTQAILIAPISFKGKLYKFDKYNESTDARDHMETYESLMEFHAYPNTMKCRALSITLQDSTRKWYR